MSDIADKAGAKLEMAAWYALVAAAFSAPVSIIAGRAAIAAVVILLLACVAIGRMRFRMPAIGWWAAGWVSLAAVVTAFGLNPAVGVPKLPKLLWFLAIPFVALLVNSPRRMRVLAIAIALGGTALAIHVLVRNPILAIKSFEAGGVANYAQAVIEQGSMTNGQRMVVTLSATFLLVFAFAGRFRAQSGWWAALALQGAGFVMNFKRGSWAVAAVVMGAVAVGRWRWRAIAAFVALVGLLVVLPPVRQRLGQLGGEFDPDGGGRLTMWVRIAPALVAEHPMGIGVRALTNDMMRKIAATVERDRDHLHCNLLQVLVDTGWIGLVIYLAWMAVSLRDAWRFAGGASGWPPGADADRWLPFLALAGLMLNGFVEYNMGDAEIVLLYILLMGMAAGGARWSRGGTPYGTLAESSATVGQSVGM